MELSFHYDALACLGHSRHGGDFRAFGVSGMAPRRQRLYHLFVRISGKHCYLTVTSEAGGYTTVLEVAGKNAVTKL